MKKTLKTIVAAVLCLIMSFGAFSAFAAENTIVTWYDDAFYYGGELQLGKNNIEVNNDKYVYYNFNAENGGYYEISYPDAIEDNEVAVVWNLEKHGGYYFQEDGILNDLDSCLFFFDEGDVNLGIIFAVEYEEKNADVSIEYLGSEITDIAFDKGIDYPLINNIDVIPCYYSENEYYIYINDFDLVFDSGKTKAFDFYYMNTFECNVGGSLKKGENTFVINFEGKEFTKNLSVAEATDYVEKIELISDSVKVIKYYNNDYDENLDSEFRIVYKDGSTVTAKIDEEIDLKTGNPDTYTLVCRYSDYGEIGEELYGTIRLAGHDYLELEVEISKASFSENTALFIENIGDEFSYIGRIGNYASKIFEQDSSADRLRAIGSFVSFVNNSFFYAIGDIFAELGMFLSSLTA